MAGLLQAAEKFTGGNFRAFAWVCCKRRLQDFVRSESGWRRKSNPTFISIDTPLTESGESTLGELIPDESASSASDDAEDENDLALLGDALRELTTDQQEFVRRRYGIGSGAPEKLGDIAATMGFTESRASQLEAEILGHLRYFYSFKDRIGKRVQSEETPSVAAQLIAGQWAESGMRTCEVEEAFGVRVGDTHKRKRRMRLRRKHK